MTIKRVRLRHLNSDTELLIVITKYFDCKNFVLKLHTKF